MEHKMYCKWCHNPFMADRITRRFCSRSCLSEWKLSRPEFREKLHGPEVSAKRAIKHREWWDSHPEVKQRFSSRMSNHNPMQAPGAPERLSATMKRLGHKPKIRGGKGTGPTRAEAILLNALPGSLSNYPVKTGMLRGSGFPQHYKVDVALPELKLAIEADGGSHNSPKRRAMDLKKETMLRVLGWTVLRFKNRSILESEYFVMAAIQNAISQLKGVNAKA